MFSLLIVLAAFNAEAQDQKPTHANVKYGPHERNVMDVWLAKSDKPTPVLVSIHGGGFAKGDKRVSPDLLRRCLDSGISVVAITYRFSQSGDRTGTIPRCREGNPVHPAQGQGMESRRPAKVAATGSSAGAGLSLWLGFHDDLADPKAKTRCCANRPA